jgi:uncharacterized protein (TIGR02001 family)
MKKTILALAALVAGVSASAADGQSTPLAVSIDATYVSTYVFRGLETAGASIQPSIEANYKNFYAGAWYSREFDGDINAETDLYAGHNFALNDTFTADVGVTRYLYEGGSSDLDSTEVYLGVTADVLLSPSLYSYYDFDNEQTTFIASIGHSVPVESLGLQVDFSALTGYVQRTNGLDDYGYWGLGAAIPYQLSESARLTAAVNYTHVCESTPTGGISSEQDQVVYSLGVSIGF